MGKVYSEEKTQRQSRALPLGVINEEQEDETEADKGLEAPDDYSEGWSKSSSISTLCLKLPLGSKANLIHWGNKYSILTK